MESFVFYESFYATIKKLPSEMQAEALEAIVRYGISGEEYSGEDITIAAMMELIMAQITLAKKKREECSRGGRASRPKAAVHEKQTEPQEPPKPTEVKAEPAKKAKPKKEPEDRGAVVCVIPLNQGTHEVREKDVLEWQKLYPAVDVMQELRSIVGWSRANPQNRKTKNGVERFIAAWLKKEQDKSRTSPKKAGIDYSSKDAYSGGDSI